MIAEGTSQDMAEMSEMQDRLRMLVAFNHGWTRDGDRDYCPECSRRRNDAGLGDTEGRKPNT